MFMMMKHTGSYYKMKVDAWFKKVFKDQAGGAELIATLVIIGIVLILAFIFKDKLIDLVKNIWNKLLKNGDQGTGQGDVVDAWE